MAGPQALTAAQPQREGIVLFGHGSRDPAWRAPMDAVARRVQDRAPGLLVRCAFLELTTPDLPAVAAEFAAAGVRRASVLPLFLGVGRHAREDLPAIVQGLGLAYPGIEWVLQRPVGEDPGLLDLLATLALQGASSAEA